MNRGASRKQILISHFRIRLRPLLNSLAAALLLAATLSAEAADQPANPVTSAGEESLRNTRWNIASYMYLLHYGSYDRAGSEKNIAYAARLEFNAVRFNVWWHNVFPDAAAAKDGGNWEALDHNVDYAVGKGLKVILTLSLRRP